MSQKYGIIAAFDTVPELYHACEQVRDAGYSRWDSLTSFPIHGLDAAMGMPRSKLPRFSLAGGITGFCTGMGFIAWLGLSEYPLVVGGKPMFSPFAAFPPSYELTILFGAFGSLGGMLFLNRLPKLYHPLLKNRRFGQVTHDKYFLVIETSDPKYVEQSTIKMLETAGSNHIEVVEE